MEVSEIELRTREKFGDSDEVPYSIVTIEKGGSGRVFLRVSKIPEIGSTVVMHYTDDRPDNVRFAPITDFLVKHQIPVPGILYRDEEAKILWVEDLGEIDLQGIANEDWDTIRRPAYESALRNVFLLHEMHESESPAGLPEMEPAFDEDLYQWERGYCTKRYVAPFVSESAARVIDEDEGLERLGSDLASRPRSLIHRDFQSTNVMVLGDETRMIDYQGMRWGLPEYDIASMVYDPYTEFSEEQRGHLIDYYFSLKQSAGHAESEEEYRAVLTKCAIQRLMQALGAYGYISEVVGKPEFLQHIPVAKERLLLLAGDCPDATVLIDVLGSG